jgi:hypothetical protein
MEECTQRSKKSGPPGHNYSAGILHGSEFSSVLTFLRQWGMEYPMHICFAGKVRDQADELARAMSLCATGSPAEFSDKSACRFGIKKYLVITH